MKRRKDEDLYTSNPRRRELVAPDRNGINFNDQQRTKTRKKANETSHNPGGEGSPASPIIWTKASNANGQTTNSAEREDGIGFDNPPHNIVSASNLDKTRMLTTNRVRPSDFTDAELMDDEDTIDSEGGVVWNHPKNIISLNKSLSAPQGLNRERQCATEKCKGDGGCQGIV